MRSAFVQGLCVLGLATAAWSQTAGPSTAQCPQTASGLYERVRSVGLDPHRVYHVRDAFIDRPNLHFDFEDGTLAFTEDICGRITGAMFEGEGEIRLRPPNRVERASLALFTGMAILEEQFSSAYLRFNDDTAQYLERHVTPETEGAADFIREWDDTARTLAEFDSLRLLRDFSHSLPERGRAPESPPEPDGVYPSLLHVHMVGKKLGGFEVFWDGASTEPVWLGQPRAKDGVLYFDIWSAFAPSSTAQGSPNRRRSSDATIAGYKIRASVEPPTRLQASTEVEIRVHSGGERTLLFELSRYLKVDAVESDGQPVDFIQNPALAGSNQHRKGNDLIAVVFPAPLKPGEELKLHFTYAGDVLSDAGNGLLYVGARGTWYPNFGLSAAQFEMEFHYPAPWTLVATGKQITPVAGDEPESGQEPGTERISRWVADRAIPVAGFNLGKYNRAESKVGDILVEAYGTHSVERSFPKVPPEVIDQPVLPGLPRRKTVAPMVIITPPPSPSRNLQAVADRAANAIGNFTQWFGPFPYSSLALTQMPGNLSQGWPGLVFLSSFAFLSPQEQTDLQLDPVARALDNQVLVHETAHQWWGDLVSWSSYRDQWIAEGLANYSSLLILEQQSPSLFHQVLESYRRDLCRTNKDGERLRDAGPVTLGPRLESTHFPGGYEAISYERGTWLFHMLRSMLRDAQAASQVRKGRASQPVRPDEPFMRALRRLRERYAGKKIGTEDLMQVFEEELPRPLWYENRHKLDWFLEGWIEGTAIPTLATRDTRVAEKGGVTTVTGTIVQQDAPEDLVTAVPVYAATTGNTLILLGEVLADGPETPFRFAAPAGMRKIVLDPNQTILSAPK